LDCPSFTTLNKVTEFTAPLPKLEAAVAAQYDRPSVGLLQGLPISVKECVDIGGQDTTVGTARRLNQPKTEDAVLVQVGFYSLFSSFCY